MSLCSLKECHLWSSADCRQNRSGRNREVKGGERSDAQAGNGNRARNRQSNVILFSRSTINGECDLDLKFSQLLHVYPSASPLPFLLPPQHLKPGHDACLWLLSFVSDFRVELHLVPTDNT